MIEHPERGDRVLLTHVPDQPQATVLEVQAPDERRRLIDSQVHVLVELDDDTQATVPLEAVEPHIPDPDDTD